MYCLLLKSSCKSKEKQDMNDDEENEMGQTITSTFKLQTHIDVKSLCPNPDTSNTLDKIHYVRQH